MSWDNSYKGPELDEDVEEEVAPSPSSISDGEDDNIESSSQLDPLDSESETPFLVPMKTHWTCLLETPPPSFFKPISL